MYNDPFNHCTQSQFRKNLEVLELCGVVPCREYFVTTFQGRDAFNIRCNHKPHECYPDANLFNGMGVPNFCGSKDYSMAYIPASLDKINGWGRFYALLPTPYGETRLNNGPEGWNGLMTRRVMLAKPEEIVDAFIAVHAERKATI